MTSCARILIPALLAALCGCAGAPRMQAPSAQTGPALIPLPVKMTARPGHFRLDGSTVTASSGEAEEVAEYLAQLIRRGTGWQLARAAGVPPGSNAIVLELTGSPAASDAEGYTLEITPQRILIKAARPAGLFYGVQTLRQLWPAAWEGPAPAVQAEPARIPCLVINDQPRYSWRGGHLDVCRHFFPIEFIYRYIDYLAMNKMNTFHWHLTDDQGWRIEIKKYPLLTEVGGWRVDRSGDHWNKRAPQQPGEKATYSGYYSQEEIRAVVEYASSRFITIVPEIEMPAHAGAALAAYPRFSCTGGPFTVPPGGVWPIVNLYCAGDDTTFSFLQDILDEVIGLFPGDYIHIGGDEADKSEWKKCPKCQARIRTENLGDETGLQSYMIRRMAGYLHSRGKRIIGWDEILEGGLAPRAAVMSWRGMQGGIDAARADHDVVMTPTDYCYFDYYQGPADFEPLSIGGYIPIETVYAFEPTPASLDAKQAKHILGCQANLWTEFIATPEHAEYMLFPRLLAMAEVAWSPKSSRGWDHFLDRLTAFLPRLEAMGVDYSRSLYSVKPVLERSSDGRSALVALKSPAPFAVIHYTLDGAEPTAASPRYESPITLQGSSTIKAGLFLDGALQGRIVAVPFLVHKASGQKVTYTHPWSDRYQAAGPTALVDGLTGSKNYNDGSWQGFEQHDLEVVIDLGREMEIRRVSSSYLEDFGSWIFAPREVSYAFSDKGKEFQTLAVLPGGGMQDGNEITIHHFGRDFSNLRARYLKVTAKNIGGCPPDHAGAGGKAWLFVDEIIVE